MKSITLLLAAASAGLATAQLYYNETTNQFTCAEPNQAYCVSDSLQSTIIVRCDQDAIGSPGNCDDNLDGEPPQGVQYSPCWQTSNTTGDAACSKNCVVYGGSGSHDGTFTLPADECTPTYTATASSAASAASSAGGTVTVAVGTTTKTTTECPESATSSAGAVTGSASSAPGVPAGSAATTATGIPNPLSPASGGAGTSRTAAGGSTTSAVGAVTGAPSSVASRSSSAVATSSGFAVAGAVSNRVGAGLGVVGLVVGALI